MGPFALLWGIQRCLGMCQDAHCAGSLLDMWSRGERAWLSTGMWQQTSVAVLAPLEQSSASGRPATLNLHWLVSRAQPDPKTGKPRSRKPPLSSCTIQAPCPQTWIFSQSHSANTAAYCTAYYHTDHYCPRAPLHSPFSMYPHAGSCFFPFL